MKLLFNNGFVKSCLIVKEQSKQHCTLQSWNGTTSHALKYVHVHALFVTVNKVQNVSECK